MSDLISPSPVHIIDIEASLDESEQISYDRLRGAGFSEREIDVCVNRKPLSQYLSYHEQEHPLLFDDHFRYHTAILQHVHNIRHWVKTADTPINELISHGYALAWLHYKCDRLHLVETIISKEASRRTKGRPRKRKRYSKNAIEKVMSRADIDSWGFGMTAFREYVGSDCKVTALDGHIYISAIEDESGKAKNAAIMLCGINFLFVPTKVQKNSK
jgi:hypothetical protein